MLGQIGVAAAPNGPGNVSHFLGTLRFTKNLAGKKDCVQKTDDGYHQYSDESVFLKGRSYVKAFEESYLHTMLLLSY